MVRQPARSIAHGALLIAIAAFLAVPAAVAQTATFGRVDYPFLGNDHIVAGDLNGDGKIDLAGTGLRSARVMLGNGDGTFQPAVEYLASSSAQPQAIASGDFNRDGLLDLLLTLNDRQTGLALILGRGDGSFEPPVHFPNATGFDAPALAAADLDNDGNLDAVVGHEIACYTAPCIPATSISVLLGNGDGSFQPARVLQVGSNTAAIGIGDFNRDGVKDLALASSTARVHVLLGRGDATFTQETLTLVQDNAIGMDNTDIDVADVNGDLIDDLVVALSLNGSKTVVLIAQGDGSFGAPHVIQEPAIRIPHYQAVADYNGDGRLDLALSLGWGTEGLMEIRNGNGDGTFGPLALYLRPPDRSSISGGKIHSADFNGDGKPDIALGWIGASAGLAILRNATGVAPPPRPSAPALLAPFDGATVAQPVALDWTDVAHATAYQVQVDNSSTIESPFVVNVTVTASQVTLTGLPAQRLWWRVRARNSDGVYGPFSAIRRFTPQAALAPASLSAIGVSPSSVTGGAMATGTVTLTSAAPAGGAVVSLSSSNAAAAVPSTVTIGAGATGANFTVTTLSIGTSTPVTVSAAYNGVTRSAVLTVNPPGQTATLTVTATGRSGERVSSTPAGISVPVGATGSASFTIGASITLSVSNGRDAVWSGACSTGGEKRRTCTFTLKGNASVNANVQ